MLETDKCNCSEVCCDCYCKCDCCEKVRDKDEGPSIIFFQFRFTHIKEGNI